MYTTIEVAPFRVFAALLLHFFERKSIDCAKFDLGFSRR